MTIELTTKYSKLIDERFTLASVTEKFAGKRYDWDGAQSIKIYSVDPVAESDYNRTASAGRFGTIAELGDTVQTCVLTQDKAFTFAIDHGNAADQMNIKHCNARLKQNWDEVCAPNIDKYRFRKWADGAGLGAVNSTALTKSNILETIMTASAAMSNCLVPKKNRALFIGESLYFLTKLADQVIAIDKLGEKAVTSGVVGYIDGMAIVPVPDSYLPQGVNFIIKYKDATADPMKLKTLRVQRNPLGFDADVGECRYYHDSFVLASKINGIYVHAKSGVCAAPTLSLSGTACTITAGDGATVTYTLDGTNPKTSDTAQTWSGSGTVTVPSGQTIRAYASKSGEINSAVVEAA